MQEVFCLPGDSHVDSGLAARSEPQLPLLPRLQKLYMERLSPTVSRHNFLSLGFGENYRFINLILILLQIKTPEPVEIEAENKCDYLKIIGKRNNGAFTTSAPGEVEKIKAQRN